MEPGSAASTRPSTPFYYLADVDGDGLGALAGPALEDPPPSYPGSSSSSDGDRDTSSSSVMGSPRPSHAAALHRPSQQQSHTSSLGRRSTSFSTQTGPASSIGTDDLSDSEQSAFSSSTPANVISLLPITAPGAAGGPARIVAETSARTLRRADGPYAGETSARSAFSSRAPSPSPPVHPGRFEYTHHIHHHHYHSPSASTSGSSASLAGAIFGNAHGDSTITSSRKGKEPAHTACNSEDYAVPIDYGNTAYHYRAGPLARKLGSAILSRDPSLTDLSLLGSPNGSPGSRRRSGWKSPRRKVTDADYSIFDINNGTIRSKRKWSAVLPAGTVKWWNRFTRHPLVPAQPLTIVFTLGLLTALVYSITLFMYHILSPDKSPRPWRAYCQEQRPFPHELADSLAPVDVFVGVFSVDAAYERRHMIRSTYLRHSRPIDPNTGRPGHNVQVKFILGRPRKHHARRVALEMETYNDIVVLDVRENMNQGKTHNFFKWANENATVPVYYKAPAGKRYGPLTPVNNDLDAYNVAFKKADYVVKADDDSFLVLSELERHLRVSPREQTYWGYLIRNLFMGGECYALSADLVNYVATSPALEPYTNGAEDKRVAKWMRMHPNASSINWVTERCYVYDHPKAATTYSHGFLFPDEVERVRAEGKTGISAAEKARRGGEIADAWSTVSKWKRGYVKPKAEMTMEEEIEALIEGGGRWTGVDDWTHKVSQKQVVRWDSVVFDYNDQRLKGVPESARKANQARTEYDTRSEMAFGKYNRMPNTLIRDPGDSDIRPQHAKRSLAFWKRAHASDEDAMLGTEEQSTVSAASVGMANTTSSIPSAPESATSPEDTPQPGIHNMDGHHRQIPIGQGPNYKQGYSLFPSPEPLPETYRTKAIPAPQPRFDSASLSLRERRFLGLPYGGTVVVHYLKRNEWFLETALALLGREKMWDAGLDAPAHPPYVPPHAGRPVVQPPAEGKDAIISPVPTWNGKGEVEMVSSQWGGARMYGSPLIKENGYISLGRPVPWDAIQKSDRTGAGYGGLKGSPKQRYVDLPSSHSTSSSQSIESPSSSSSSDPESATSSLSAAPPSSTSDTSSELPSEGSNDQI